MEIFKTEEGFTFPVSPYSSRAVFVRHDGSYGIQESLSHRGEAADQEDIPEAVELLT